MIATVGTVVSTTVLLLTVTVIEELDEFPAASLAVAVSVCEPLAAVVVSHGNVYGLEPSVPRDVPSTLRLTEVTPTLSLADTPTLTPPETVAASTGEVTLTVGGVLSTAPPPPASATARAALMRPQP